MTGLHPTGLAFGRVKITALLGYKSGHTCEPYTTGESKDLCNFLIGEAYLPVFDTDCAHMLDS